MTSTNDKTVIPLTAAVEHAERGWFVTPFKTWKTTSGKAMSGILAWKDEANRSNDPDQVRDWWAQFPDAAIGVLTKPSNLIVIDLDLHSEEANGLDSWHSLLGEHAGGEIPQTYTVRTPTGGLHIYFTHKDERLKNSASKLGPGIDTRGTGDKSGGIVLGAGTTRFDGTYTVEDDSPVAPLPEWLLNLLLAGVPSKTGSRERNWDYAQDRRFTIDQAREFVLEYGLRPLMAASNGSRNNALNTAAIVFSHFGEEFWPRAFAEEKLRELAVELGLESGETELTIRSGLDAETWRAVRLPDADPEDEDDSFQREVDNYVRKHDVREAAEAIIDSRIPRKSMREMLLDSEKLDEIPDVEPLIEGFLFRRSVAILYGRRNVGKTFAGLDMALSVATGRVWGQYESYVPGDDEGMAGAEVRQGKVLWIAGEGAYGIRSRVASWKAEHGITTAVPLHVHNGAVEIASEQRVTELCALVAEEGYDLVVIDTLARNSAGLEENSASDMKVFFDRIEKIKNAHDGATVLVIHHQGKGESTESRGSTVIEDSPDSVFRMSGDETCIFFETTKQRDTVKAPRIVFHLEQRPDTGSAVILRGKAHVEEETTTASEEMETRDIFMEHFERTGCTGTQWRDAIVEKTKCSKQTAYRRINAALDGWDAVTQIKGGPGRPDRYEVA